MVAFTLLALALILGGAALAHMFPNLPGPKWARIAFIAGAGAAFGLAATSIVYTIAEQLVWWWSYPGLALECAITVALILQIVRNRQPAVVPASRAPFPLLPAAALLVALLLATAIIANGWDLLPEGNWDAWSIWNLRAKFLATPTLAARAWSPLLTDTHPEYPLLLSGAIARCWNAAHDMPNAIPMAIGYIYFLSLIAMVTGGIAMARGAIAGFVAGLVLACTTSLVLEVPAQYADIPLAAYLAGALVLVLLDRPVWAGIFAGCAAWTKDEGAMFCAILLLLMAIFRRRDFLRALGGMLPAGAIYAAFKLFLAPHVSAMFGPGSVSRFTDAARWKIILPAVDNQFMALGAGWIHPILILIALAIAVKFRADSRRDAWLASLLAACVLAAYVIAMVTSPNAADWQANTAGGRLIVQWWPLAVIAIVVWLRPAGELAVEAAPDRKSTERKTKKRA